MRQEVVLVPGLWMPAAAMLPLAARLADAQHATRLYGYRGRDPFEANVERFARYVREKLGGAPAHFVGHSLGGVLILDTLSRHPELRAASALLLGAPVRGCLAGRRFAQRRLGRWMLGAAAERFAEREASWQRHEPLGVVAGTRALGLGAALDGGLPGQSDGVVRVEETGVQGMTQQVLLPIGHSLLIASTRVARLAGRFLGTGRFE